MNGASILLLIVIVAAIVLALRSMKKRSPSCGGNCSGCTMNCSKRKEP